MLGELDVLDELHVSVEVKRWGENPIEPPRLG
jgi:hypothetical protein